MSGTLQWSTHHLMDRRLKIKSKEKCKKDTYTIDLIPTISLILSLTNIERGKVSIEYQWTGTFDGNHQAEYPFLWKEGTASSDKKFYK